MRARGRKSALTPQREAAEQHCEHLYPTTSITDLFSGDATTGVLLALTLIPVAILWIVGGIVIVTLRWIARGFRLQPVHNRNIWQTAVSSPSSTASGPPLHVELPAQQQAAEAPQQQQGAQQQKQDEYMGLLFWAVIIGVGVVLYNHPEWPISKHVAIFLHNLLKELGRLAETDVCRAFLMPPLAALLGRRLCLGSFASVSLTAIGGGLEADRQHHRWLIAGWLLPRIDVSCLSKLLA